MSKQRKTRAQKLLRALLAVMVLTSRNRSEAARYLQVRQ